MIGWPWVIGDRVLRRFGIKEVWLKPRGLDHRVSCRIQASDIYPYTSLLGRKRVSLELPIRPKTIVDAGANVGFSVLRFKAEFPDAVIIAIEPEPGNVAQFRKNCGKYKNVFLEEKALWSCKAQLRIADEDVNEDAYQVRESEGGPVQATTVPELMNKYRLAHIDLLKVDVEGAEKEIFSHPSAREWLPNVGIVLVETHDRFKPGCSAAIDMSVRGLFRKLGCLGQYEYYVNEKLRSG